MTKFFNLSRGLLTRKINTGFAIVLVLSFSAFGFGLYKKNHVSSAQAESMVQKAVVVPCNDNIKIVQKYGYDYTHPLLIAEMSGQSAQLNGIKNEFSEYINEVQKKGVKDCAVFFLRQNHGNWIGINQDQQFSSTGYIRLAILITCLRQSESNPTILERKLFYSPASIIASASGKIEIPVNQYYSVRELLKIMMTDQDTTAKSLLTEIINKDELRKLFRTLNMAEPDFEHRKFSIDVTQYSKFLQLLYNANYLNKANSEYALSLLSDPNDTQGLLKYLPEGSKAIHKYSERFNRNQYELRESGIIYNDNDSYLLTIFASSKNKNELDTVSGRLGKMAYDWIMKQ